jgi:hypothetical protein
VPDLRVIATSDHANTRDEAHAEDAVRGGLPCFARARALALALAGTSSTSLRSGGGAFGLLGRGAAVVPRRARFTFQELSERSGDSHRQTARRSMRPSVCFTVAIEHCGFPSIDLALPEGAHTAAAEQHVDPQDRRARIVKATIKGLYVAGLASAVVAGATNRLARDLSPRDRRALATALERITSPAALDAASPASPTSRGAT